MAHGFDAVPVWIKNEGCEIIGMIEAAQSGRAIVLATDRQRGSVKGVDSRSIRRAEAQMHAA